MLKVSVDEENARLKAENARLAEEVQARTAELQARTRELTEWLESQTATSDVLAIISSSPTQVQPVFASIAASAQRLCNALWGAVVRYDGKLIELVALSGLTDSEGIAAVRRAFPRLPIPGGATDRAILNRAIAHIPDILEDLEYPFRGMARAAGFRSHLSVPMLHDGRTIGAITVAGSSPGHFSERQTQLLRTFADQAVIAIQNARLFEEVQARTRELTESTAAADRHGGRAQGHQSLDIRLANGARHPSRIGGAALRSTTRADLPVRRHECPRGRRIQQRARLQGAVGGRTRSYRTEGRRQAGQSLNVAWCTFPTS